MFIHSVCGRHWGGFHLLVITNNTIANVCVQVFVWTYILTSRRDGIVGLNGRPMFNFFFSKNCQTVFHSGCTISHSHQQCMSVLVSPHPHKLTCLYYDSYPSEGDMTSHCGFAFYSCDNEWCWVSFHALIGHLYIFFEEVFIQILSPF